MKKKILAALCTVMLVFNAGCGGSAPQAAQTTSGKGTAAPQESGTDTKAAETPTSADDDAVNEDTSAVPDDADISENENAGTDSDTTREYAEKKTAEMTLEQKIAQMMFVTLRYWNDLPDTGENASDTRVNVTELNDKLKEILKKYDFGGVCLYNSNITGTEQTVRLTSQIQEAALASENGIPMLIGADQEGGSIVRLKTGTTTPGNMALGAAGDPQTAYDIASVIGGELSAVGINTDFAPVLDVNNDPANPVINVRSFGSDPQLVKKMTAPFIKGLEDNGVVSTVKHFPGHGDTGTDSHTGLPMIDKSYSELKDFELIPFEEAVRSGADMVMTAHIQFPQIETQTYTSISTGEEMTLPATLSETIISDILRFDMGYDGVVITDAMLMDAIDTNIDPIDAAVLSINADVDMILEPMYMVDEASAENMGRYIDNIADAVRGGRIDEAEIDDSVVRILKLKYEKGLMSAKLPDVEKRVPEALGIVGSESNHNRELEAAKKAVTLVKNDNGTLPFILTENTNIAYFYPFEGEENTMTFALGKLKEQGLLPDNVNTECHFMTEAEPSAFEETVKNSDIVIIATETYRQGNMNAEETRGWQARFTDEMIALAHKNGKKAVHLSMHFPYDAARYTEADATLCAYNGNDMPVLPTAYDGDTVTYGVNYPAALITVFGGNTPVGKLPVDIPVINENTEYTSEILYPAGFGLTY